MKVTVDIPDRDYWRLTGIAERNEATVQSIVQAAVLSVARVALAPRDTVRGFVLAGLPDGEISIRTGMTVQTIATHRRSLGLPPNRRAVWQQKQAEKRKAA